MTRSEYAEMVEWLEDHYGAGRMQAWSAAGQIAGDFDRLDSESVWECVLARVKDPTVEWPHAPKDLIAAALDRMRHKPRPALPETTETYGWREHSMRTWGHIRPINEVVEERARPRPDTQSQRAQMEGI